MAVPTATRETHRTAVGGDTKLEIDKLLAGGLVTTRRRSLSELARLGARLIIQRAVEDEFDAWLGRARYERRPPSRARSAARRRGCGTGFARGSCRPGRVSLRSRSRRSARRPSRSSSKLFPSGTASGCCGPSR